MWDWDNCKVTWVGKPNKLQFKGIFRGEHGLEDDNIHEDKPIKGNVPTHS
jgi:hypothetical protein